MVITSEHTLLVCSACKGEMPAKNVESALCANVPTGYQVRMVACMAGCARPVTVGFQASGKEQYLFGDILSSADLKALAEFAHQYAASADGWTKASERPKALFDKTLARIPRIEWESPR